MSNDPELDDLYYFFAGVPVLVYFRIPSRENTQTGRDKKCSFNLGKFCKKILPKRDNKKR